jgi:hypothetical protein
LNKQGMFNSGDCDSVLHIYMPHPALIPKYF